MGSCSNGVKNPDYCFPAALSSASAPCGLFRCERRDGRLRVVDIIIAAIAIALVEQRLQIEGHGAITLAQRAS